MTHKTDLRLAVAHAPRHCTCDPQGTDPLETRGATVRPADPPEHPQHYAEVHFPDDGVAIHGVIICSHLQTATVRLAEQTSTEFFAYGRSAILVFPSPDGLVSAPCRLVAEYNSGLARDLVVVVTGDVVTTERRKHARIACSMEAAYRAEHEAQARDGRACGAWRTATAIDISQEGLGLLVAGHPEFPEKVELQVMLPEPIVRVCDPTLHPAITMRSGTPVVPDVITSLRLRAEMRRRLFRGADTVIGLQFQCLPSSVQGKLEEVLAYLARHEVRPDRPTNALCALGSSPAAGAVHPRAYRR